MDRQIYRYAFDSNVEMFDVESALLLAVMAAEGLHGEAAVRLDFSHALDAEARTCVLDASGQIGQDVARLFTQFFRREFSEDAFVVERRTIRAEPTDASQATAR